MFDLNHYKSKYTLRVFQVMNECARKGKGKDNHVNKGKGKEKDECGIIVLEIHG